MKKLTALILATALVLTLTFTSCDMIGGSVNPPSASTKKGDIVRFGQHDWRVLYVRSGSALLLSDEVIEKRPYHTVSIGITWENSSIREYLNGDFYNNIFTEEEKDKIRAEKGSVKHGTIDKSETNHETHMDQIDKAKGIGVNSTKRKEGEETYDDKLSYKDTGKAGLLKHLKDNYKE